MLGTLVGALLGTSAYYLFPPEYRAQATVVVDFNLEQAWPRETDRQLFYYLERETRKLEEVAWSDSTLEFVAARVGDVSISELRSGKLLLGQPGEGGWHFWADDHNPAKATQLASAWAEAFGEQVHKGVTVAIQLDALHASLLTPCNDKYNTALATQIQELESRSLGISPYIQAGVSQIASIPNTRKTGIGTYVLVGATSMLVFSVFFVLFMGLKE